MNLKLKCSSNLFIRVIRDWMKNLFSSRFFQKRPITLKGCSLYNIMPPIMNANYIKMLEIILKLNIIIPIIQKYHSIKYVKLLSELREG